MGPGGGWYVVAAGTHRCRPRIRLREVRMTGRTKRCLGMVTVAVVLLFLLSACSRTQLPQDTFNAAGPEARKINSLFWPVFWIAVGVFVLVEGLLVFALVKYRRRSDHDAPRQVHGNTRLEVFWTILPAALLAGIAVPTVITIFDVAKRPVGADVVHVKVT